MFCIVCAQAQHLQTQSGPWLSRSASCTLLHIIIAHDAQCCCVYTETVGIFLTYRMGMKVLYGVLQMCVLGGHNGSAWLESVTTHKPHAKNWGHLPDLDGPRSFAAADTWNNNVFVMGGGDGTQWFNSVLRYAASRISAVCQIWPSATTTPLLQPFTYPGSVTAHMHHPSTSQSSIVNVTYTHNFKKGI